MIALKLKKRPAASAKTKHSVSWAPTQSLITVTVQPIYSRREIEKFSLQNYVKGEYIKNGGGLVGHFT